MTGLLAMVALVAALFFAAGVIWWTALAITDLAHQMRGDVRCGPGCPCRGNAPRPRG